MPEYAKRFSLWQDVIPSEVENGAAGEGATWTGRPKAERRDVSESNPVERPEGSITGRNEGQQRRSDAQRPTPNTEVRI